MTSYLPFTPLIAHPLNDNKIYKMEEISRFALFLLLKQTCKTRWRHVTPGEAVKSYWVASKDIWEMLCLTDNSHICSSNDSMHLNLRILRNLSHDLREMMFFNFSWKSLVFPSIISTFGPNCKDKKTLTFGDLRQHRIYEDSFLCR